MQNQKVRTFLKICSLAFSEIIPDDGINVWVKVTLLDFEGKLLCAQNGISVGSGAII